jgi:hypothetical protein
LVQVLFIEKAQVLVLVSVPELVPEWAQASVPELVQVLVVEKAQALVQVVVLELVPE